MKTKALLEFPESNDGVVEGVSDAGIETFKGNPIPALVREGGQNSGDAPREGAKGPVKITFELINIPVDKFPGYAELKEAVSLAQKYWKQRNSKKAIGFLEKAMVTLKKKEIPCLKMIDRNTTGLTGSDLHDRGNWFGLTKAKGVSEKASGAGGSYGIGKNAFFANSTIRTVFFSTHDEEDRWAFQGVSNLVSHVANGKLTKAIGFYGMPEGYRPITGKSNIPSLFQCDGIGTDIVIAGFNAHDDWEREILMEFAENFFVAIHEGQLEVAVVRGASNEVYHLNSETLADIIDVAASHGSRQARDLLNFYDALTSDEAICETTSIEGLGEVELRLLKREGARKRIAMFRKNGLKIFEKDRFRTPVEFVGVFRCLGAEGNSLLRIMEPPAHDKWEAERHDDPKYAAKALAAINEWIREKVSQLQLPADEDKQSLPGMEQLLPDDFEDPFDSPAVAEGDPHPQEIKEVKGVVKKTAFKAPPKPHTGGGMPAETSGEGGDKAGTGGQKEQGEKSGSGAKEEISIPHRTFLDPNQNQYRMVAEFPAQGSFDIHIFAIGDDGKAEPISLQNAKFVFGGKKRNVGTKENCITGLKIPNAAVVEIQFDSTSVVPRTMFARVHRHV